MQASATLIAGAVNNSTLTQQVIGNSHIPSCLSCHCVLKCWCSWRFLPLAMLNTELQSELWWDVYAHPFQACKVHATMLSVAEHSWQGCMQTGNSNHHMIHLIKLLALGFDAMLQQILDVQRSAVSSQMAALRGYYLVHPTQGQLKLMQEAVDQLIVQYHLCTQQT